MTRANELVSVIIPAHNAGATLDETLKSVRDQTYPDLEILVIDDGSTDSTAAVASRHARIDSRIRILRQPQGGVAAARNRGLAEARGEYVAPLDADDLWRPEKLEKQVAAMSGDGAGIGLVYTWYAVIDEHGSVVSLDHRPTAEGAVLRRMCLGNLIGNGSSALMRKAAALEAGGYDTSLLARGAQGCEDLKLYFRIAERHRFAVVPEYLTGYRCLTTAMSSDVFQMLRSFDLVIEESFARHPEYASEFRAARSSMMEWLVTRALQSGRYRNAFSLGRSMLAHDFAYCLGRTLRGSFRRASRLLPLDRRPRIGSTFERVPFTGTPFLETSS
jgi:glycosyltransferase involved in cell wall biosynthesis